MELSSRIRQILRVATVKVITSREVNFPFVAESNRTSVMALASLGGLLRVLIEHKLAACDGARQRSISRKPRQAIMLARRRRGCVEDIVIVVGAEIRIQRQVQDPRVYRRPRRRDIRQLQERCRVWLRIRRRQDEDLSAKLDHQHSTIGQEFCRDGKIESGCENLVLEVAAVCDVHRHRRRHSCMTVNIGGQCRQRVSAVAIGARIPRQRIRISRVGGGACACHPDRLGGGGPHRV